MNSAIGDKKFLDGDEDEDVDESDLDKSTDFKNEQNFPPQKITTDQQHNNDEINKKRTGSRQK